MSKKCKELAEENDVLSDLVIELLAFINLVDADYRNGVEWNGIDEGEVLAARAIKDFIKRAEESCGIKMEKSGNFFKVKGGE